ncbi:hypothetical protein GGI43DRAFT_418933 [Trichoderma evansii]
MSKPMIYRINPTKLVPNSPNPLLHYKSYFSNGGQVDAAHVYDTFQSNGWQVQWVSRYGKYQRSHYHPETHEVMVVLSGPGIIRWGVADTDDDWEKHTYGQAYEDGGLQIEANVGDVFVIPAGVAHKSFDPRTSTPDVQSLTGGGHGIESGDQDPRDAVCFVPLSGFTMMGAYPQGFTWSWSEGGDHLAQFDVVRNVAKPERDPILGNVGGTSTLWK